MILLITGASEAAREVLAEHILADEHWRHLALEDLHEEDDWERGTDLQDILGTSVACECARDEFDAGHPVVVTCPTLELVDTVLEAFPSLVVTIHMGSEADAPSNAAHIVDPSTSAKETYAFLKKEVIC